MKCKEAGTPIICSMGAGNKMDPTRFEVTDIYKTSVCPLAKVMRTECASANQAPEGGLLQGACHDPHRG